MKKGLSKEQQATHPFHKRLKSEREAQKLSQEKLAQALGFQSPSLVSAWERNRMPSTDRLIDICRVLNVSADYLLGLQDQSSGGGMGWTILKPPPNTVYHNQAIEEGIVLFNAIVHGQKPSNSVLLKSRSKNTATLRNLLRNVFVAGILRIVHVERDTDLEARLFDRYPNIIKDCFVAKLNIPSDSVIDSTIRNEAVAFLAAQEAVQSLQNLTSVGLAGGSVISRWVDLLQPSYTQIANIKWISMVSTAGSEVPFGNTANAVIGRLVYTQGVSGQRMPYINAERRTEEYFMKAKDYELDELRDARETLWRAQDVQSVFMSIGVPETNYHRVSPDHPLVKVLRQMPQEEQKKCVGDVLLRLIDRDGNPVGTTEDQRRNNTIVHSISLDDLRNIAKQGQVWILAGQSPKSVCIHAALKAGLANSLVIDTTVANALLREGLTP